VPSFIECERREDSGEGGELGGFFQTTARRGVAKKGEGGSEESNLETKFSRLGSRSDNEGFEREGELKFPLRRGGSETLQEGGESLMSREKGGPPLSYFEERGEHFGKGGKRKAFLIRTGGDTKVHGITASF